VTLLLALVLASSPHVLVLQRAALGVQPRAAVAILTEVKDRASKAGLEATRASACEKDHDCLPEAAASAAITAVGVSIVSGPGGITVDLEALSPTGESLATWTGTLPPKVTVLPAQAEPFFALLASKLPKPAPAEAPPAVVEAPQPLRPARPLFISAGVAAAGAIGFGIATLVLRGPLEAALQTRPVIPLTSDQAMQQINLVGTLATTSLVLAIVALSLGLGGVASLLFE